MRNFLASSSDQILQGANQACGSSCGGSNLGTIFGNVANALIFLVGSVAVIMIIIGGLRYILSQGDAKAAAEAKNTILYSVIGVVVAVISYAIVRFVIGAIK